ncbi:MAG TPA: MFS transporter, partial [Nevskiaceae bacterium]|nr:MFS transporter [Nevskiaceae bacterium]
TLGSLGCAASRGIGALVAARVLQGLGGAMMVPVARLVLVRQMPRSDLVSAMATVTIPALVAPILGPPVGGLIVTYASWPWIFLINLPIGVLGWQLVRRHVGNARDSAHAPLDLAGWWLLGGGLAGLVFGFENIGKRVLPQDVSTGVLAAGALLLALYVRHARAERWPILRLSLLRVETFRASVAGGSLFRIGVGSFTLLLPMMLQLGYGLSTLHSGLLTFASALGALGMKTIAQRMTRRYGFRPLLVWNSLACATALAACGWLRPQWPAEIIIVFLAATGALRSLQFTCINALAFADVAERDMSQATSFSAAAQQLALTIGVGIGSQVLNASLALRHGSELAPRDFTAAFCVVALLTLASSFAFSRLSADAGSAVSGHRLALATEPVTSAAD